MYQNVVNSNPIIVGNNPPMRDFVEKWGCGVVVDTDGSDVQRIVEGLKDVLQKHNEYKHKAASAAPYILWNSQDETIKTLFLRGLNNY